MSLLILIVASTFLISLISFIGILVLMFKEKLLRKLLFILVAFSAGSLLGGAFLHLIPEAIEESTIPHAFLYVLVGFVSLFFIERVIWQHCHAIKCPVHTFTFTNLIGDGVHNFLDGLIIAGAFVADVPLGVVVTLAVALHEIPQEIGDFGVLVYGRLKKSTALIFNFLSATLTIFGGLLGYLFFESLVQLVAFLLLFAAGGFIYIAASDLIPEIRKDVSLKKFLMSVVIFIFGILIMWLLTFYKT